MSFNRENVIWQSADGTWNRAFYEFYEVNQNDEDFDPEWDVEYTDRFNWVRTGLASEKAAEQAWHGANPGGWSVIHYTEGNAKACDALDAKAREFLAEQAPRDRSVFRY